ncbi:uncharacterized protein LOC132271265 [Cornus florida]|uniref:uncharacterized protein LOC132271265 n=1 Tax=Cornus florida TaxID=4283 RepID=UPI0028A10078|nr:uncharacterized protein LOC132271265 [Cornus florida]
MGNIHLLHFPCSLTGPSPSLINPNRPPSPNPSFPKRFRCHSTGRGRSPSWDSNAEKTIHAERFRFNLENESLTDDDGDEDGEFGFRSTGKQRVWWSDDSLDIDDEEQFGFGEDSISINWIIKLFRAFGWMVPAIIISLLVGTGPNAFFMALALPLAQSALSLAADTLWNRSSEGRKAKPRTKKKPFARASSNVGMGKEKEENTGTSKGRGSSQSWAAANDVTVKKGDKSTPSFGGWDELDIRSRTSEVPKRAPPQRANSPRQQKKGKLSRRLRSRDTPMLLRLLIAIFPFLGSWTKLF